MRLCSIFEQKGMITEAHLVPSCLSEEHRPDTKLTQRKEEEESDNCSWSTSTESVERGKYTHTKSSILSAEILLNTVTLDALSKN